MANKKSSNKSSTPQPKENQKTPKNENKRELVIEKKVDTEPIEFSNDPSHFDLINKKIRALKKKLRNIMEAEKKLETGKKINADQTALISNKHQFEQNLREIEEIKKSLSKLDLTNELQLILGVFHYSNRSETLAKFAQLLSSEPSTSVNYGKNLLYGNKEEAFPGTSYSEIRNIVLAFISQAEQKKEEPVVVVEQAAEERGIAVNEVPAPEVLPEAHHEVKAEVNPEVQIQPEVKHEPQPEAPQVADDAKEEVKSEGAEPASDVAETPNDQKQDKNFKNRNRNRGNRRGGNGGNRGNRDGGNRDGGNRDGGNRDGGNRDGGNRDGGNRDGGNRDGNRNREGNRDGNRGNRNRDNNREGGNRDGNRGGNRNQGNRRPFKPQNNGVPSPQQTQQQ